MFPKATVKRFGHTIKDRNEREAFLDAVDEIETQEINNAIVIMGGAFEAALKGTSLEHFISEFSERWQFFLTREDLDVLKQRN